MTKLFRICFERSGMLCRCLLLAGLLLNTGCSLFQGTFKDEPHVFSPVPVQPVPTQPVTSVAATNGSSNLLISSDSDKFAVADLVMVSFSGTSSQIPQPHEERIKEDGKITLPLIGSVIAAGKSPGELQKDIRDAYSQYYKDLTVTVKSEQRMYHVGGEVRSPGRFPYLGPTTVIKAIQSAGDFTDFAKKTKVKVTRANGKTITVDCKKALKDPKLDIPIFPNDRIVVDRSIW